MSCSERERAHDIVCTSPKIIRSIRKILLMLTACAQHANMSNKDIRVSYEALNNKQSAIDSQR